MSAVLTGRSRAALAVVMSVLVVFSGGGGAAFAAVPAYTYTVGPPIAVEGGAFGAAVDPGTHSIYVTNVYGASVSVIDGLTKTVTTTIGVGSYPYGVAVDPVTHTVYVTNYDDNTVSVIDGTTHSVTDTINVGRNPYAVAVDPGTHTVYVSNNNGDSVSVIDGTTKTVTDTISVGRYPHGIAVDPSTHTVYVANYGGSVSVIDGTTKAVTDTISVGSAAYGVAVDPVTHTAYVTSYGDGTLSVIDGTTKTVTGTIAVGGGPYGVAVDTDTDTVYVPSVNSNSVSVIDATTNTVTDTIGLGASPYGVAVDPGTHAAYVTNNDSTVSVITQQVGSQAQAIQFTSTPPGNPVTGGSYEVSATGGGSGNPVTFTIDPSSTVGACTVTDRGDSTGTVTFTAPGSCVVAADQAAADGYSAAPQAQQTMAVSTPVPGTADLSVTLTAPDSVPVGSLVTVGVTVANQGPATARKTETTVAVPHGFTITSAGGGTRYGSRVVFKLPGGLAPRVTRSYTLLLTATRELGTVRAATRSSTPDPYRLDNTTAATIRLVRGCSIRNSRPTHRTTRTVVTPRC